jgi:proline dehydrogenase
MGITRRVLLWCSGQRWLGEQAQKRRFTRKSVLRFMPGEGIESALGAAENFRRHNISTMLYELGENVTEPGQANEATKHYVSALDRIAEGGLDAHISLKLTHLGLDLDVELTYENLVELVEHAQRTASFVWVDMEGSAYTDRTLDLFQRVRKDFSNVGICLQTYLYRTPRDLETLLPHGSTIRLVKGAYNEPRSVAHPKRRDVDESFYELAVGMLGEKARSAGARLAVATHDLGLIDRILERAESTHVPKDAFEIQMLYGIQREAQIELARRGYDVRVLVSYGTEWFPWFMRRLAERPANLWFLIRNLF